MYCRILRHTLFAEIMQEKREMTNRYIDTTTEILVHILQNQYKNFTQIIYTEECKRLLLYKNVHIQKSQSRESSALVENGLAMAVFGRPVCAAVNGLQRRSRSHARCALGGRWHIG